MAFKKWFVAAILAQSLVAQVGAASPQPQESLAEPSASARDLFSRYKERLLQVRVLLSSASEQSSLGSGFVVQNDGDQGAWVVTNYHVVSALAMEPAKYRIELRGTNERSVKARVMAVDVIHDLAVLRTEPISDTLDWKVFDLRTEALPQGARVYSLGNPLELGFLISEGIYNGLVESRIYDQMLFSGAINSGMSGGPAIDANGRVVGVNVATRRDGQALSFLVPVQYVNALLQAAQTATPRTEWRSEVGKQLQTHQAFVTQKLLQSTDANNTAPAGVRAGFSTQTLAGRTVPTLNGNLTKCWAGASEGEKLRYQRDSLQCALHADLYVSNALHTGSITLKHVLLRNEKLATAQFLHLNGQVIATDFGRGGREKTRKECHGAYVKSALHRYQTVVCVRAYRQFAGVYDLTLQAEQVDDAQERLASSIELRGFSFDNAQRVATEFLGMLQ